MVNSQVVKEIVDVLKLDQQRDLIPTAVPVFEVSPKKTKSNNPKVTTKSVTGSSTILVPTTEETYVVTGIHVSIIKDATCDIADGVITLQATIGGIATLIASWGVLTTTAQAINEYIDFSVHPIKLDVNSSMILTGTFTAGKLVRTVTVYGYIDEIR